MRWIKAFSLLMTLGLLCYIGWYFFSIKSHEQQRNAHQKEQIFIARFEHARMKSYLHDYDSAEKAFLQLTSDYPEETSVQFKLAQVLSWREEYSEAATLYLQLLKTEPENIQFRRHYARVLMWMGKHSEAAEEMRRTLPPES